MKTSMRQISHFMMVCMLLLPVAVGAQEPPKVVVSIAPIHSLVAQVMEGVGVPSLLMPTNTSPHSHHLKPSEAQQLQSADIIIWVGAGVESFLPEALEAYGGQKKIIELQTLPTLTLYHNRAGGVWEGHAHVVNDHSHDDSAHTDPHLWLDIGNAIAITQEVATQLSAMDSAHAERYAANATRTIAQLKALDIEMKQATAPFSDLKFIVFHDAYQYLEKRYDVQAVGSIALVPEAQLSAKRLEQIRQKMMAQHVDCIFSEPQFPSRVMETITEGTGARLLTIDPIGSGLTVGTGLYAALLRQFPKQLAACAGHPHD